MGTLQKRRQVKFIILVIVLQRARTVVHHIFGVFVLVTTIFTVKIRVSQEFPEHLELV